MTDDLVNVPRKLFEDALARAQATVSNKTADRAQFGRLDHIDGERLLETLAETVTMLRAAARPGPGGCECLARVTAERDEAIEALRAFIAWMDDSRTPGHAVNPVRYMAHCSLLEHAEDRARAILAKHGKGEQS